MSCGGGGGGFLFTRANILGLYRDILRASKKMPTSNKIQYIQYKARKEFRKYKNELDTETRLLQIRLGMTQLDAILMQAQHLSSLDSAKIEDQANEYWKRGAGDRDIFS